MKIQSTLFAILGLLFCTHPAGAQWVNVDVAEGRPVVALTPSGTSLFASALGAGVFFSTDNGTTWTASDTGPTIPLVTHIVSSLVGTFGTNLFAATYDEGVFLSTNDGVAWTRTGQGLPRVEILSMVVKDTNVFVGTFDNGVFRSTNNGATWARADSGSMFNTEPIALVFKGNSLFAGLSNWGGVLRSMDNGFSWSETTTGPEWIQALAVCGSNLFAGSVNGVIRSTDDGSTWTAVNSGLTELDILTFAVAGQNLFAGTNLGGVFLTSDQGTSWTKVGGFPHFVLFLAASGTDLFVGTDTLGGLWKRPLSEMVLTSADNKGAESPIAFSLHQNYPNPFNPTTVISYQLPGASDVKLSVFDVLGREVSVLVNEKEGTGHHEVQFDGSGLTSGVYLYRLRAGDLFQTRKLLLLR